MAFLPTVQEVLLVLMLSIRSCGSLLKPVMFRLWLLIMTSGDSELFQGIDVFDRKRSRVWVRLCRFSVSCFWGGYQMVGMWIGHGASRLRLHNTISITVGSREIGSYLGGLGEESWQSPLWSRIHAHNFHRSICPPWLEFLTAVGAGLSRSVRHWVPRLPV